MSDLFSEESDKWAMMMISDGTTRHDIQGSIEGFAVEMRSTVIFLEMDVIDRDSNELRR